MERGRSSWDETVTVTLAERAASDLSVIRSAMERAGRFTALPGWSGVFLGVVALAAFALSLTAFGSRAWPWIWLGAACLAGPASAGSLVYKARRQATPLLRGRGLSFLLGLSPPLLAGAVLTAALWQAGRTDLLPTAWLLLYGTALVTSGAYTIRVVPVMGALFMGLGVAAWLTPDAWDLGLLAAGFGGLHVVGGVWIASRHG